MEKRIKLKKQIILFIKILTSGLSLIIACILTFLVLQVWKIERLYDDIPIVIIFIINSKS